MAAAEHLFSEVSEMQKYFPFDGGFKFPYLESDLALVEEKFFRQDVLGDETFDLLLGYIGDDNYPPGGQWEKLRDKCRDIAARLTGLYRLPESNVKYTASGLLVSRTENAVPASDNRTKDLKLSIVHKSQLLLDLLVRYLNRNTSVFVDWAVSENRKEYAGLIIPDAIAFSQNYSIEDNSWIFRKVKPTMVEVEDTYVLESLGPDYLAELRAEIETDSLSPENALVRNLLQKMVANFTMVHAFPRLGIDISPRGIILFSNERGQYDESFLPADKNRVDQIIEKAKAEAAGQRWRLQRLLDDNASATKYATYFASDVYTNPEEGDFDFGNDPDDHERNGFYTG